MHANISYRQKKDDTKKKFVWNDEDSYMHTHTRIRQIYYSAQHIWDLIQLTLSAWISEYWTIVPVSPAKKTNHYDMEKKCSSWQQISVFIIKRHIIFSSTQSYVRALCRSPTRTQCDEWPSFENRKFRSARKIFFIQSISNRDRFPHIILRKQIQMIFRAFLHCACVCVWFMGSLVLCVVNAWMSEISIRSIYLSDI